MRRPLALFLAAVTACAPALAFAGPPPPPPAPAPVQRPAPPVVRLTVLDTTTADSMPFILPPQVTQACTALRVLCLPSFDGIPILLIDEPRGGLLGVTFTPPGMPCLRWIVSTKQSQTIAHELGHALGLDHVDVLDNLMHPTRAGGGWALTAEQLAAIARGARALAEVC